MKILAAIPLAQYASVAILAIAATGLIYLSYFLGGLAILRARLNGWPKRDAPFKLGRWGMPVSVLGLAWGGGMLINALVQRQKLAHAMAAPEGELPAPATAV